MTFFSSKMCIPSTDKIIHLNKGTSTESSDKLLDSNENIAETLVLKTDADSLEAKIDKLKCSEDKVIPNGVNGSCDNKSSSSENIKSSSEEKEKMENDSSEKTENDSEKENKASDKSDVGKETVIKIEDKKSEIESKVSQDGTKIPEGDNVLSEEDDRIYSESRQEQLKDARLDKEELTAEELQELHLKGGFSMSL